LSNIPHKYAAARDWGAALRTEQPSRWGVDGGPSGACNLTGFLSETKAPLRDRNLSTSAGSIEHKKTDMGSSIKRGEAICRAIAKKKCSEETQDAENNNKHPPISP